MRTRDGVGVTGRPAGATLTLTRMRDRHQPSGREEPAMTTRRHRASPSGSAAAKKAPPETLSTLTALAQQLRAWTDSVLGIAGAAADVSLRSAKAMLPSPEQRKAVEKAGAVLRGMREAAGLSLREVGKAIDLEDPALLELVERGKVALPFEIILRLAAVLGRNDPVSFVMRFTRSYNPDVWHTLERLGIGRLAVQAGREREFANLYRGSDAARRLDDDEFARLVAFLKAALELALALRAHPPARRPPGGTARSRSSSR
jgi:transcriptional regulator with XRE-family HTH domain